MVNEVTQHYAEFGADPKAPDDGGGFHPDFAFVRYLGQPPGAHAAREGPPLGHRTGDGGRGARGGGHRAALDARPVRPFAAARAARHDERRVSAWTPCCRSAPPPGHASPSTWTTTPPTGAGATGSWPQRPARAEDLVVDVADPRALGAAERAALLDRIRRAGMALYRSPVPAEDKELPRALGAQLGLHAARRQLAGRRGRHLADHGVGADRRPRRLHPLHRPRDPLAHRRLLPPAAGGASAA